MNHLHRSCRDSCCSLEPLLLSFTMYELGHARYPFHPHPAINLPRPPPPALPPRVELRPSNTAAYFWTRTRLGPPRGRATTKHFTFAYFWTHTLRKICSSCLRCRVDYPRFFPYVASRSGRDLASKQQGRCAHCFRAPSGRQQSRGSSGERRNFGLYRSYGSH